MKKIISGILVTAVAVSVFSGCNGKQLTDVTTTTSASDATVSTNSTVATTQPADDFDPQTFEELYGTQIMNYLDHQYYFDGQAIPLEESNYYLIGIYSNLSSSNAGYYPTTALGTIDLSAEFDGEDFATWGDFIVYQMEKTLQKVYILNARAKAEGIGLSEDSKAAIESTIEIWTSRAQATNRTLDELLDLWYGGSLTSSNLRPILERYYIAYGDYTTNYNDNFVFTDEQKSSEYPLIRYALFLAPEADKLNVSRFPELAGLTEDELAAKKTEALELANSMVNACSSIDDITALAVAGKDEGTVKDQGDIAVPKGQMVPEFENWAYGANRKVGEIAIIYDGNMGYFVVGYLGYTKSQSELDQIVVNALNTSLEEEIAGGTHNFHTDDVYLPAPAAPTATPVPET